MKANKKKGAGLIKTHRNTQQTGAGGDSSRLAEFAMNLRRTVGPELGCEKNRKCPSRGITAHAEAPKLRGVRLSYTVIKFFQRDTLAPFRRVVYA